MSESPPRKEAVVLQLLAEGDTMLCLDARCEGVRVPPEHARNPALRLILNRKFPHPIEVTEAGISANLSFGGRRFACFIPMQALWAAFNPHTMQGMLWPDSVPPEVLAEMAQRSESQAPTPRVIAGKGTAAKPEAKTPRQRGHLRLIK
ncbi:MAG: hypothetical protein KatS3mg131_0492 [Candidatus Tectimicrobiota bacterium]|nr:MAG: hypothetical protein KatS3mg131_0492 [Candidatus Tectomicrobia bacterium]